LGQGFSIKYTASRWISASTGQKKYGNGLIKVTENASNGSNYAHDTSILEKIVAQGDFY
jgi:hypothetical protein